jgi:hypothetical protein
MLGLTGIAGFVVGLMMHAVASAIFGIAHASIFVALDADQITIGGGALLGLLHGLVAGVMFAVMPMVHPADPFGADGRARAVRMVAGPDERGGLADAARHVRHHRGRRVLGPAGSTGRVASLRIMNAFGQPLGSDVRAAARERGVA